MQYSEIINKINKELESNGVNSLYTLIANDIEINIIKNLMTKNTNTYNALSKDDQNKLIKYLNGLKQESKLILNF